MLTRTQPSRPPTIDQFEITCCNRFIRHAGTPNGATTKELMARIGHSSYEAAIRYQHVVAERDAAIADALEGLCTVRPLKAKPKRDRSGTDVAHGQRRARRPTPNRVLSSQNAGHA